MFLFTVSFRSVRVTGAVLALVFIIATSIWHQPTGDAAPFRSQRRRPFPIEPHSATASESPSRDEDAQCREFPDRGNIAIAVKTGATEAVEKIPMLMLSSLRCAEHVMIFSDLEQEIAGYHIQDALADVPSEDMKENSDFDFYWKLKEAEKLGEVEKLLRDYHDPRVTTDLASWTLDKYKFLHVLEKLYAAHPHMHWYLLLDADTYLVWPTLLMWLDQLPDPTTNQLYLGSPAQVGDVAFAHGGSGIFISQAAMYELAVANNGTAARWNSLMHEECCGDLVLASELLNSGIALKPSWPTTNGEKPATLPFGPTHWCQPVVSMHHLEPHEMNALANFEHGREENQIPLTFAELYHNLTNTAIPDALDDWDNASHDVLVDVDAVEHCRAACDRLPQCFQYAFSAPKCHLATSFHLGRPRAASDGEQPWRSGWLRARIDAWVADQPPCEPQFPWTETQGAV